MTPIFWPVPVMLLPGNTEVLIVLTIIVIPVLGLICNGLYRLFRRVKVNGLWEQTAGELEMDCDKALLSWTTITGTYRDRAVQISGKLERARRNRLRHVVEAVTELEDPLWKDISITEYNFGSLVANIFRGNPGFDTGDKEFDEYFQVEGDLTDDQKRMLRNTETQQLLKTLGEEVGLYEGFIEIEEGNFRRRFRHESPLDGADIRRFARKLCDTAERLEQFARTAAAEPDSTPQQRTEQKREEPVPDPEMPW